jgi:Ca-activated chloride channel family protein
VIGFELLRPALAWLLLLALLAQLTGLFGLLRARAELALLVVPHQVERFVPGFSRTRAHLRVALGALGILFLSLAALGPVRGYTYRPVSRKGLDLVLCLDTSRSMLAQDLRPSRLERAKREVLGLLDRLEGDRVALIGFSGDAREVAPLTRDRATLEGLLAFVTPEDNQLGGTDVAAALEHALGLFDGRTGAHEAIVLLTDGEDLEGAAAGQAEEARRRGIKVFVVGIGTEAGGKIPVLGPDGRPAFLRDPDGAEVVTKLSRSSLEALAQVTGGAYLSAEEAVTPLEDLYRTKISRLEGRELSSGERRVPYDRYQWALALAVLCLLGELGLRARRPARRERRGAPRLAAALLPLVMPAGQEGFSPERSLANAVRHQRSGELEAAAAAARAVLQEADRLGLPERDRARAHFALGVIAATRASSSEATRAEDWQGASTAFSAARALAGPGELRLDATYDLGWIALQRAEQKRARIPELAGAAGSAPAPPVPALAPGAGSGAGPGEEDPLGEARALYREARSWFLERLQGAWQDADTRANLELVLRRLKELERIEEQREQQQQEQQQQQGQSGQPGDQEQERDEQEQQQNPEQDRQPDQESPGEPGEERPPGEEQQPAEQPQQQEQPTPGAEEPRETQEVPRPEQGAEEAQPSRPAERKEEHLTREEVLRLLDRLAELEKQGKAIEAALRARKRTAVKRDW